MAHRALLVFECLQGAEMATKKKNASINDSGPLLSEGQIVTLVIGYPDGGSETIDRGTVIGSSGPLVKIKREEKQTVVNTTSFYFIKAVIEER
jgi:hypothetical protein